MKVRRSSKSALFASLTAMLLCFAMFLGSTYAWFTDSVSSTNNIIKTGNLDVELLWSKDAKTWETVTETTNVFEKNTLWEPGHTQVVYLKVINKGSLALKYQLSVNVANETGSTNSEGQPFKLSDHIMYGIAEFTAPYADREAARTDVSSISKKLKETYLNSNIPLYPASNTNGLPTENTVAMVVYMPEDVGNAANAAKGSPTPTLDLGINLTATQMEYENDSFGNGYDTDAQYPSSATVSIPANSTEATEMTAGKVSLTLPAAIAEGEYTLSVPSVTTETDSNNNTTLTYEITLLRNGEKVSAADGVSYPVELYVGTGLNIIAVTHNGSPIENYSYDETRGVVSFETDSFSPFAVTYSVNDDGGNEDEGGNEGGDETTEFITFEEFAAELKEREGSFDGTGREVLVINKNGNKISDTVTQFFVGGSGYGSADTLSQLYITNTTFSFGFAEDETATAAEGELIVLANVASFIGCSFNGLSVTPWGADEAGEQCSAYVFDECLFDNVYIQHPINESKADNLTVTDSTFTNGCGGIYIDTQTPVYFSFEDNTFKTNSDGSGILRIGTLGDYSTVSKVSVTNNTVAEQTQLLFQQNTTVTEEIAMLFADGFEGYEKLFTEDSILAETPDQGGNGNEGEGGEGGDGGNVGGGSEGEGNAPDEGETVLSFTAFLQMLEENSHYVDGTGETVTLKYSEATSIENGVCSFVIDAPSAYIQIETISFIFDNEGNAQSTAKIRVNGTQIYFDHCTFTEVSVDCYGDASDNTYFDTCKFNNVNGYAITNTTKSITVVRCEFTNCPIALFTNSSNAECVGFEQNSIIDNSNSALAIVLFIGPEGDYSTAKISVFDNLAPAHTMLRLLNSTVSYSDVMTIINHNLYRAPYTSDSTIPEEPVEDNTPTE